MPNSNTMMNENYYINVPNRLLESILFSDTDATTKDLAWLLSRFLYGFRMDEISIKIVDLKALGIDVENLPLSSAKINKIGWYEMDYTPEILTAKRNKRGQIYIDNVKEYSSDLIKEIGVRSYEKCLKNKTK